MAHQIVIIGGGFGGLYAAKALGRADASVTLLDKRNFHLFQPLLYQVATGSLAPGDVSAPLRSVLRKQRNTKVLLAEAVDLDPVRHVVILADGEVPYDSLIVATGSENFYFGNEQWEEIAPGLKSVEDATRIRHKILYAFEAAEKETDPAKRRAWLTFVIVGAGATGVELAGALGEIANDVLKDEFRSIRPQDAQIILLEGTSRVLPPFAPDLSHAAERSLIKLGVRPRTGVRVTEVDAEGVNLSSAAGTERIETRTVLWGAGVRGSAFGVKLAERTGAELDRGRRIIVTKECTIPGHPEIFVIGDLAHFEDEHGRLVPGVAPPAIQQGHYVASVILRRLQGKPISPFHYWDKGSLAVIGRAAGVAEFGKFHFGGLFAWLLWLFIHLMYLAGFQNRLVVFVRWGFSYLTFNRGARLITGTPNSTKADTA
jgi:NADH:ubiquinone reductase (H+-translocating)